MCSAMARSICKSYQFPEPVVLNLSMETSVHRKIRRKLKVYPLVLLYTLWFGEELKMSTPQTANLAYGNSTPVATRKWKKLLFQIGGPLVALYFAVLCFFDYSMHQPPETFSRVMMRVGPVPFLLFPFETMWKSARAGHLKIGDQSPDFTLPLLDHSGSITLSSFRGQKPVVLIFGSYT
jgi:hypothetical protein